MNIKNKDLDIKVEYVTRVEGHGNIVVNLKNGNIEKCEFHVVEHQDYLKVCLEEEAFLRRSI